MLKPLMLDLFAGTGGASQVMRMRGWDVIRVENDGRFPAHHRDIKTFSHRGQRPVLVWASPPCTEFSRESMPWCRTGKTPSMDLVFEALRVILETTPQFWVIENVRGAQPWFRRYPMLGAASARCGPVYLWGKLPPADWPQVAGWKERLSSKQKVARAAIPHSISEALANGVERWAA